MTPSSSARPADGKKGHAKRALDFIRRARAIDSNHYELMYNEGLILALAGKIQRRSRVCGKLSNMAIQGEEARSDPELTGLRSDPEFDRLLNEFTRSAN